MLQWNKYMKKWKKKKYLLGQKNSFKTILTNQLNFSAYVYYSYNKKQGVLNIGGQIKSMSSSKGPISTSTFLSFLYSLAWTEKLCCCGNNSSYLTSSLDRWRAGSQVHDDMGHPFHLMRYSISYEKINKRWNGRLKTSLRTAPLKQALSTYVAAFPLRKQSFVFPLKLESY